MKQSMKVLNLFFAVLTFLIDNKAKLVFKHLNAWIQENFTKQLNKGEK